MRCDDAASAWSSRLRSEGEAAGALELLVDRVELQQDGIQLSIKLPTESFENLAGRGPARLKLTRLIPFYERLGYALFGTLEDYPEGHSLFFMTKRLTP